jgi:hypothetical protein
MVGITIGGVPHDKVFGGEVPGPIWGDMMTGALEGKPVENFNTVHIPDGIDRDRGDGNGDDEGRDGGDDGGNDNGGFIGGLVGGNNGGGGDQPFPTPSFSIPEGFFRGQGNGGNGNGGRG